MNTPINAKVFGCAGDGFTYDTNALFDLFGTAQQTRRAIYFPMGEYVTKDGIEQHCIYPMAIYGDGMGASKIVCDNSPGLSFTFDQDGAQQPVGLNIRNLTIAARGTCGFGLKASYGQPEVTNDHLRPSVVLRDVGVESSNLGHWNGGVVLESCWNSVLDNVYASGNACGGQWNNMAGSGISLEGMCVNTHISNCRTNFWATGLYAHGTGYNHEGIFCANNSMVAVKRGVWLKGNPGHTVAPRVSTLTWVGGLIENRVGGVTGGLAAFHLDSSWDVMISGVHMLTETLECPETTYGIIAQDCKHVIVQGSRISAYHKGFCTTGECDGVVVTNNVFTHNWDNFDWSANTKNRLATPNVVL